MEDFSQMQKYKGKTIMRDDLMKVEVEVRIESLDKYHFFMKVPVEDIKPFIDAEKIGNLPWAWSFPTKGGPSRVIGSSTDGEFFYFYVETEEQTRTRITRF